jgi:hypothetical protein
VKGAAYVPRFLGVNRRDGWPGWMNQFKDY